MKQDGLPHPRNGKVNNPRQLHAGRGGVGWDEAGGRREGEEGETVGFLAA